MNSITARCSSFTIMEGISSWRSDDDPSNTPELFLTTGRQGAELLNGRPTMMRCALSYERVPFVDLGYTHRTDLLRNARPPWITCIWGLGPRYSAHRKRGPVEVCAAQSPAR